MRSWLPAGLLSGAALSKVSKFDPIALAAEYNPNPEVIKTLRSFGLSVRTPAAKASILELATSDSSEGLSKIKALCEAGANLEAKDRNGRTPLMLATQGTSNVERVKTLIASGANVNARDKYGNTALIFASKHPEYYREKIKSAEPYLAIVKALLAAGANVNAKKKIWRHRAHANGWLQAKPRNCRNPD